MTNQQLFIKEQSEAKILELWSKVRVGHKVKNRGASKLMIWDIHFVPDLRTFRSPPPSAQAGLAEPVGQS